MMQAANDLWVLTLNAAKYSFQSIKCNCYIHRRVLTIKIKEFKIEYSGIDL